MNLKKAQKENGLEKRLKHYSKYRLLIVNEVGFLPLAPEASKLFFRLIAKRDEKNSTIISTNIDLKHCGEMFEDPVLADVILDRLLHHCKVVYIVGDSYRLLNALQGLKAEYEEERGALLNKVNYIYVLEAGRIPLRKKTEYPNC